MNTELSDSKNFIKKLSVRKILNHIQLKSSFHYSVFFGKYYHSGNPTSMALEITNHCNLHCPECPAGQGTLQRPRGVMDFKLFTKIIDEVAPDLMYLTLYFQGEPYLNNDLYRMIKYASEKKIYTALSTNAQQLDLDAIQKTIESGLNRIIISIDGTTQEVYEKYRIGGSLKKVIEATEYLVKIKKQLRSTTPYVVHQFLVSKENEQQISDFFKLAENLNVNKAELKTLQLYDLQKQSNILPENKKYSRYIIHANGTVSIKKKLNNNCYRSWSSAVITWDGTMVPCCFDKDASHLVGEISQHSINTTFKTEKFSAFRKKILQNRKGIKICNNCTE